MTDNKTLKANARAQLGGNIFANIWLMFLVCGLIFAAITGFTATSVILALLVIGPLSYGMARIAIKRACGITNNIDISDLFVSIKENVGEVIILGLLSNLFIFLWGLLFVIPGLIKKYSWAMAFYIQQDNPGKGWKECLDESAAMMKGYKWQLFCIDVTMLLWTLVGSLVIVGGLFVIPYKEMTYANFYLARKANP